MSRTIDQPLALPTLAGVLARLRDRITQWRLHRSARGLLDLDDRLLRDIGLTPHDVDQILGPREGR